MVKLKLVVLDKPYYTLPNNSFAQEMFAKMLGARFDCYEKFYPKALPGGAIDYVADHIMWCTENNDIVMAMSCITAQTCAEFGLEFPATELLSEKPRENIEQLLHDNQDKKISYIGSLVHTRCRGVEIGFERLLAFAAWQLLEHKRIDINISMGTVETCKLIEYVGFKYLDKKLLKLPHFCKKEVLIQIWQEMNKQAVEDCMPLLHYWDNRIHIGMDQAIEEAA